VVQIKSFAGNMSAGWSSVAFRGAKGNDGGTQPTARTLGRSGLARRGLIVAFRSCERTSGKSPFRGAKGNDRGTQPTSRTLGRFGLASRSLIVAFRSCERMSGKSPFRGAKGDTKMPRCVHRPQSP
jgi:hypothetical protein